MTQPFVRHSCHKGCAEDGSANAGNITERRNKMEIAEPNIATWIVILVLFFAFVGLMLLGLAIFLIMRYRKH
jgi:hypothetical protein